MIETDMVERDTNRFSEKGYFHVCTNGNSLPWMFKDDDDFIAGVNRIGICKTSSGVDIIDYTLMDNHVHFLLYGTIIQCQQFITKYKLLLGRWIQNRYNEYQHLKHLQSQIIPIPSRTSLMEVIAYIDRNPIVAGYKYLPTEYQWGASKYFFKEHKYIGHNSSAGNNSAVGNKTAFGINSSDRNNSSVGNKIAFGINSSAGNNSAVGNKKISECTKKDIIKILKTKIELPSNWEFNDSGMLDPRFFLNLHFIESLFQTPGKYLYFLSKKLEGPIDLSIENSSSVNFVQDKELRNIVDNLAGTMYNCKDINSLDVKSRLQIARKLRFDYMSSVKQISRMLNLNVELLKGFV